MKKNISKTNKGDLRQKIANYLANKTLLRKIPFIDRFVVREQNLLLENNQMKKSKVERTEHDKFIAKLSDNGKYKNMSVGQQIKALTMDTIQSVTDEFKKLEPHSIVDQKKMKQMKNKIQGKTLDDD